MLKRTIVTALTFALIMSSFVFAVGNTHAQRTSTAIPGTWQSAILIQNTAPSTSATVVINFYDSAGALKFTYPSTTSSSLSIEGGKSKTLIVPTDMATLGAGQYSVVVSSTTKIIASVQTSSVSQNAGPWTAFAYEGVGTVGKTLFFPAQMNSYYGFFSEMVIQNTSETTATNLSVKFYNASGGVISTVDLGSLGANRAVTWAINDAKFTGLPSGNANGLFGAVVTSSATDIAGITNVWSTQASAGTAKTASYNGFTSGSTAVYAPNLMNNYYGFASALTLQNVDPSNTASGTITYSNGKQVPFSLAPYAAASFYQPADTGLPSGNASGTFSANAVVTAGSIVGIVGFSLPPELNKGVAKGDYAYYNCPSTPAAEVYIPNVLSNYYGLFTAVSVQNTSGVTTDITLTYDDGKVWKIPGVGPNGIANFMHIPKVAENPFGTASVTTSARATATNGATLVAVVQHNTEPSLSKYNSAKTPADFMHVFTATPKQ